MKTGNSVRSIKPAADFLNKIPKKNLLHQLLFVSLQAKIKRNKIIQEYMKSGIHPENYRPVAFRDMSNGETFISRSTVAARETEVIDGVEYPLVKLEISSSSHPFYTGKSKLVDTAGRVDKFMSRYAKRNELKK